MDLIKWYKNIIESGKLDPPVETWDNIQDELDIDASWQAIEKNLDNKKKFITWLRISAAASIAILVAAGAGLIYYASINNQNQQTFSENLTADESATEKVDATEEKLRQTEPPDKIIINETPSVLKIAEAAGPVIISETREYKYKEEASEDIPENIFTTGLTRNPVEPIVIKKPDIGRITGDEKFSLNIESGSFKPIEKTRNIFRKFYIGTTGQLANTWLVNQKTISGFKSTSLVTTNATFGSNFGVFAGTNLLKSLDLQMDLNLLAQNNQDYNEYLNGNYVTNKLKLDYSQLALSFRYYINSYKFLQGEHGVNLGGYAAYLHNAYQKVEGQTIFLSDKYNSIDYGLLIGYEYIFNLYGQLDLGTGFRAYYGLSNIYSGDQNIPGYLNKTHNASVNVTLSLRYNLMR